MIAEPSVEPRSESLLAAQTRPWAVGLIVVALGSFVALAAGLHDSGNPTAVDSSAATWLYAHLGGVEQKLLLTLSEPAMAIGILAVVLTGALLIRRWDVVALTAAGPTLAFVLMRYVLKPWINRSFGDVGKLSHGLIKPGPTFPSGHETGLTSVTVLLGLLALRSSWSRRTKAILLVIAVLWTIGGAAGLVRSGYHYATDTLGGVCLALVVMLGTALVVDAVRATSSRRSVVLQPH